MFQSRERSDKISEKCISFERYEYSLFDSTPGYNQKQKSDKISKNAYLKYLHNYDLRFLSHHIMLYIVIIRKIRQNIGKCIVKYINSVMGLYDSMPGCNQPKNQT